MPTRKLRTYPDWVLARVQELDLAMLKAFDAICREEGLTYFADGGTCLGAVRHGGFIPWDDDIDLGMPIDDYLRFVEIADKKLPKGMSLHTPRNTRNYAYLWAKIYIDGTRFYDEAVLEAGLEQGIYIDIFPYIPLNGPVEMATSEIARAERWQKASYLKHMSYTNIAPNASLRLPKMLACILGHAAVSIGLSDARIQSSFERAFPQNASGDYWGNPTATRPFPYKREDLFPVAEASYCDMQICVPRNTDAYLSLLYGEYMTLPAPEKRHVHTPVILDFGDGVNVMEDA